MRVARGVWNNVTRSFCPEALTSHFWRLGNLDNIMQLQQLSTWRCCCLGSTDPSPYSLLCSVNSVLYLRPNSSHQRLTETHVFWLTRHLFSMIKSHTKVIQHSKVQSFQLWCEHWFGLLSCFTFEGRPNGLDSIMKLPQMSIWDAIVQNEHKPGKKMGNQKMGKKK